MNMGGKLEYQSSKIRLHKDMALNRCVECTDNFLTRRWKRSGICGGGATCPCREFGRAKARIQADISTVLRTIRGVGST
jgi:hypothetical protein